MNFNEKFINTYYDLSITIAMFYINIDGVF